MHLEPVCKVTEQDTPSMTPDLPCFGTPGQAKTSSQDRA